MKLGTGKLSDALLELSMHNEGVSDYIDTLLAPKENLYDVLKNQIEAIKRDNSFVHYSRSFEKAEDLEGLLSDIVNNITNPKDCLDLIVKFIETDSTVYGNCDDSSGAIGEVYYEACHNFAKYAEKLNDEEYYKATFLRLVVDDDYGTREPLMEKANTFFSEKTLRELVDYFLAIPKVKQFYDPPGVIARQLAWHLPDSNLYKKCSKRLYSTRWKMELAKHHLKYGLQDEALSLLENMDSSEINPEEKDKLLKEIYQKQGNQEELFSVLKRKFFRTPAVEIFEEIVNTVGGDRRNELLKEFTEELLNSKHGIIAKLLFLISTEQVSIAANIIRKDYMNIDGGLYQAPIWIASTIEDAYPLEASLVFRRLVLGNLEPANSKYYSHGIRYLRCLDRLSKIVKDWEGFQPHEEFKAELRNVHGRKKSFWAKYDK